MPGSDQVLGRRMAGQLLALEHLFPVLDEHVHALLERVRDLELVARGDLDLAGLLLPDDLDLAVDLGDDRLALRDPGFEQLLDAWQALGDVDAGNTARVEGPHRQLGSGLADRLGGDHADRLPDLDQLAGRKVAPVAVPADALPALT